MVEIISIHIPKTAGQTFQKILQELYGKKLDPRHGRKEFFPKKIREKKLIKTIPTGVTVIHGHLFYQHVKPLHLSHHAKVITWLRDPVERMISNYYYLMKQVRKKPKHPHADKINYSLIDYANIDVVQNRMHRYLEGMDLKDLFFCGFTETSAEDLKRLAELLDWPYIPKVERVNDGSDYKNNPDCTTKEVTREMRKKIRDLNKLDMKLYDRARELKSRQTCW
jgi:hypothetical protein